MHVYLYTLVPQNLKLFLCRATFILNPSYVTRQVAEQRW